MMIIEFYSSAAGYILTLLKTNSKSTYQLAPGLNRRLAESRGNQNIHPLDIDFLGVLPIFPT